jgi:hypothetical protein
MDIEYSIGPRFLPDGTNLDADIDASIPIEHTIEIEASVTGFIGLGYEPGQYNKDGSPL